MKKILFYLFLVLFMYFFLIFQVMKVTREHLRPMWEDGSVMGFVGRRQAEEMLRAGPSDTFLLRFSDSELGRYFIIFVE